MSLTNDRCKRPVEIHYTNTNELKLALSITQTTQPNMLKTIVQNQQF